MDGILLLVLFAVPEGIMMLVAGLRVLGVRRPLRRIVLGGLLFGTVTMVSRRLLPGGYHIPLTLLSYCVVASLFLKVSAKTSIVACLISALLVNLGQILVAFPCLKVLGLSLEDTLSNVWLHIGFGWLSDTILLAAVIFVIVRKDALIPVAESDRSGSVDRE